MKIGTLLGTVGIVALTLMAAPAMAQDAFGGWDPQPTPTPEPVPVPRPQPRQLSRNEQSYCSIGAGLMASGVAIMLGGGAAVILGPLEYEAALRDCENNLREESPDVPNFSTGY